MNCHERFSFNVTSRLPGGREASVIFLLLFCASQPITVLEYKASQICKNNLIGKTSESKKNI